MGGAQTLSRPGAGCDQRPSAGSVLREPPLGLGGCGPSGPGDRPETPWAETGGTETKQTAPLKPPGTRVSGMSGFGLLSCSRIFKESKPFQAATPKQRAFCVAPSGLCVENKPPLLSGLGRAQGRQELLATTGAAHVPAEGSEGAGRSQAWRPSEAAPPGRSEARRPAADGGGASGEQRRPRSCPESGRLLPGGRHLQEREGAEKSPTEGDPGVACLGFKVRRSILGHFQMTHIQSLQKEAQGGRRGPHGKGDTPARLPSPRLTLHPPLP